MVNFNSKYRDSVCNAILDTNYTNPDELNINTLDGLFFDKQKNDISCTIDNHFLVLIEHQSTVNENMPFRCLSYVAELLNNLIKKKNKLYNKRLITFPKPKFFVLYDGDKYEPLLKNDSLELVVTAFNINFGLPQPLLQKCPYLSDYSTLVGKVKEGIRLGLSRRDAIRRAVKFCLDHGIMGNYLVEHSEEVFNMLALEWNMNDALQARFEDGRNEEREAVAIKMLRKGKSFDEVQEFTDLPIQRLEQLVIDNRNH